MGIYAFAISFFSSRRQRSPVYYYLLLLLILLISALITFNKYFNIDMFCCLMGLGIKTSNIIKSVNLWCIRGIIL